MLKLIGQETVLEPLRELLKSSRLPTSFVIAGPSGSGKKTLAQVLARAVLCENGRVNEDCSCNPCHKVATGIHPEVRWIAADEEQNSIKIEEIHQLINWSSFKVMEGSHKIFILNRAEKMTEEAANALLKTLEEPSADTLIFLLIENPANLRQTLLSRCFKIKMRPLAVKTVLEILVNDFHWEPEEAMLAAKCSQGWLGQALKFRDENFSEMRKVFLEEIFPQPMAGFERWAGKKRHEVGKSLRFLAMLLRDIAVYRETQNPEFLYQNRFEEAFEKWSAHFSTQAILELLNLIDETQNALQDNVNPKIALARLSSAMSQCHE